MDAGAATKDSVKQASSNLKYSQRLESAVFGGPELSVYLAKGTYYRRLDPVGAQAFSGAWAAVRYGAGSMGMEEAARRSSP